MAHWKVYDYRCENGHVFEEMVSCDPEPPEGLECELCRAPATRIFSAPGAVITIVKGNHDFAERQQARLTQRSNDHWRRQGRDEAIDRERAVMKKFQTYDGPVDL